MNINIALANFEIAYRELIGAIEEQDKNKAESDVTLQHYVVTSDIGKYNYVAVNESHAKNQFRAEHGFNHVRINAVKVIKTNVDNGKQL